MKPAPLVWLRLETVSGVEIGLRPAYSAVMLAAGLPLVVEIRAAADTPTISARLEAVGVPLGWTLDISGSNCRTREDSSLRPALEALVGMRSVPMRLLARGECQEAEITLVGPWCWLLESDAWPLIASFVLPHDGIVSRLRADLRGETRGLRAVHEVFERRTELAYAGPQMLRTASGVSFQVVRPPWIVFRDLPRAAGAGHCLDLSLLAAGVLEASGQFPLVLFVLDDQGYPIHALIGRWRDGGRRYRPLLRGEDLRSLLRTGSIETIDMVPVCRDRAGCFEDAAAGAMLWIEQAADLLAVDILALRPPHGAIAPFELTSDSIVLAAIAEAEPIAREFGSATVETSHLLCALWRSGGEIAAELLLRTGSDREQEIECCRAPSPARSSPAALERTRGFQRCLAEAGEMARTAGSTIVREADLWWAVLGGRSVSLERVFAGRPGKRRTLLRALSEISPPVRPESEGGSSV